MNLGKPDGLSEERGTRPCVVVSSELHNTVNKSVVVVPLTTQTNKAHWHEHHMCNYHGTSDPTVAMCEHVREVDKRRIVGEMLGVMSAGDMIVIQTILKEITLG